MSTTRTPPIPAPPPTVGDALTDLPLVTKADYHAAICALGREMETLDEPAQRRAAVVRQLRDLDAALAAPEQKAAAFTGALEVKLTGIDEAGRTLEGWAAAWALDSGGDQLLPTCADAFLARAKLEDIPIYWCHQAEEVPLGTLLSITPDARGLRVKVRLFAHARAQEVMAAAREMLALGRKLGFSIGYYARDVAWQKLGGRTVRVIKQLDLSEISITPAGRQMNAAAVVDGIKTVATPPDYAAELADIGATLAKLEDDDLHERFRTKQQADQRTQRLADRVRAGDLGANFTASYQEVRRRLAAAKLKYETCMNLGDHAGAAVALQERRNMERWLSQAGIHLAAQG